MDKRQLMKSLSFDAEVRYVYAMAEGVRRKRNREKEREIEKQRERKGGRKTE